MLIALIAGSIAAGAVAGASGFGAALVLQPLLLAVSSPATALIALTVNSFGVNGAVLRAGRLRRDLLVPLLVSAPIGAVAGVLIFTSFDKQGLQVLLGVAVIAGGIGIASGTRARRALGRAPLTFWGLISGALTTSVGTNGPPVVIGLSGRSLEPREQRATLAAYFLCATPLTLIAVLAAHKGADLLPGAVLGLALTPGTVLGVVAGGRLAPRLHGRRFRALTVVLIVAAGCASLAAGLT